jgi:hypothetical protein
VQFEKHESALKWKLKEKKDIEARNDEFVVICGDSAIKSLFVFFSNKEMNN